MHHNVREKEEKMFPLLNGKIYAMRIGSILRLDTCGHNRNECIANAKEILSRQYSGAPKASDGWYVFKKWALTINGFDTPLAIEEYVLHSLPNVKDQTACALPDRQAQKPPVARSC